MVILGHGFARSRARFVNWGAHLAGRGYVVLVPSFAGADHGRNADDLVAMVDWILARNADPSSMFLRRIDPAAVGATGHSAGGLAALVATARDPRIGAVALMDPVDSGNLGVNAVPGITVPCAITHSEPSSCNAGGSSEVLYAAAVPPRRGIKVIGGTHCDPEDPSDFLCTLTCGGRDDAWAAPYRRYVTGWFEYHLRCDDDYAPWISGSAVAADVAAAAITYDASPDPLPGCASPPEVARLLAVRRGIDVVLTWDTAVAHPPVTGYRLYRGPGPDPAAMVSIAAPVAATHTDGGAVTHAASHSYRISAVNRRGEGAR